MKKLLLIAGIFCTTLSFAQATKKVTQADKKEEEQFEMKIYYMVFLKKGPDRSQDSATAAKIQEGHMKHLNDMYKQGKMDLAGPFDDDGDIRGICVYNVATKEEVEKLVAQDPAIKSGRLVAEIHPWYSAKGASLK